MFQEMKDIQVWGSRKVQYNNVEGWEFNFGAKPLELIVIDPCIERGGDGAKERERPVK